MKRFRAPRKIKYLSVGIICFVGSSFLVQAQDSKHDAMKSPHGSYVEKGFPFFSQTLDARKLGKEWPDNNLTPRGIILQLGYGYHLCFDPDLLRMALLWQETDEGEYMTMDGMAPGSYRMPGRKSMAGQEHLPRPLGSPISATGIYPGWFAGDVPSFEDMRERSVDQDEIGLGPLSPKLGRWHGLRLDGREVVLLYEVASVRIEEKIRAGKKGVVRVFKIAPHKMQLSVIIDRKRYAAIPPSTKVEVIKVKLGHNRSGMYSAEHGEWAGNAPVLFWKDKVRVKMKPGKGSGAYVLDEIPLPLPNPWKRNVRPVSFDFFPDGRVAFATFDGDVWLGTDIATRSKAITWRRFASGLHDPMGLRILDGEIIVSDRNGLVRLHDRDANGEADEYENFSSVIAQTAETREFPTGFELKPGGGFYLTKGGQVSSTRGKYNGTVIELSADGQQFDVIATGLRMPFLGVDPKIGTVVTTDQQGHWKPTTPIHVHGKREYYGHQPSKFKDKVKHPQEITEPAIWIPHFVNQSGASLLWLRDAKMGPLNDALILTGYNRPEIFKIYLDEGNAGQMRQGAVVPVLAGFSTGLLSGRVNPIDGLLYLAGFKIWGTAAPGIRGLYRVRYTGEPSWVPTEVRSSKQGLLLRFDQALDEGIATSLASYTVDRWNYKRTHNYGSGHFRLNGEPGQETMHVASANLSKDRKAVFLGIPDMQAVHSMRLTYKLAVASNQEVIQNAYLTVHELRNLDLADYGFGSLKVDLTVKPASRKVAIIKPTIVEGEKTAKTFGCIACHSVDGSQTVATRPDQVVGPSWVGLYGSKRLFTDGTKFKSADEVYLRESIVDPARKVAVGFESSSMGVGMPSYLGVLQDYQIDSLLLYIKSLAGKPKKK